MARPFLSIALIAGFVGLVLGSIWAWGQAEQRQVTLLDAAMRAEASR